ncbi:MULTISPECIES: hypothetical protein [Burkholderia]|uniref:hypothetical protein n=1 Tax=Burkholderia TaxID=32008 RepID=UPI003AF4CFAF
MEVKVNRMSWDSLTHLRDTIKADSPNVTAIKSIKNHFIKALAKAIDMEIRRKEFEGEDLSGSVFVSFDLKFIPEKRLDFGKQTSRKISLKELDELANERERKGVEEVARLKRIAEQMEAGKKNIAGVP